MTGEAVDREAARVVFRVSRAALLGVGFALVGAGPVVAAAPTRLGWVLLLPLLAAVWVLWVRTEVDAEGLTARRTLGRRSVAWSAVQGFRFPRRTFARAVLTDGTEVALPAVSFNDLPALSAASGGRLTDPFAAARAARAQDGTDPAG